MAGIGARLPWHCRSSRDKVPKRAYGCVSGAAKIRAALIDLPACNYIARCGADDERNPPETGITEAALKQVKNGKLFLIPASGETSGHLTTGSAKFYSQQLRDFLLSAPQRAM